MARHQSAIVVGTGPAAWACIEMLVSCGVRPIVVDIGYRAAPSQELSEKVNGVSELALKRRFGSDHMYRYPTSPNVIFKTQGTLPLSGAFGGLSTVWGTNIQGINGPDAQNGWEIDLREDYEQILTKIPHTFSHDDLDEIFHWPIENASKSPISRRMKTINDRYRAKASLEHLSYCIGVARNATAPVDEGCVLCGQCLLGCPQGVIFSTEKRIDQLIINQQIIYVEGTVRKLVKSGDSWSVIYEPKGEIEQRILQADSLFLGAGSIGSSILLSRSELIPENVKLRDTQVVYLPFIAWRDFAKVETEFSLAQLFLESKHGLTSADSIHLSLYEADPSWPERAAQLFPLFSRIIPSVAYRQVIAGIGFLPSDVSGWIEIERVEEAIYVKQCDPQSSKRALRNILKRRLRGLSKLGLLPLYPLAQLANVGASYHVGVLTSDGVPLLNNDGQLHDYPGLYCIDGASLPALPCGPVTLSIMANSRRITRTAVVA